MKSNRNAIRFTVTIIVSVCLFLSSCTLKTTAAPTSTASAATLVPSVSPIPTFTQALVPSATLNPLPALTLTPGDTFFSLNGKPTVFFSRNIGSPNQADYTTVLGMAHAQGDLVVRMDTTNATMGGHDGYGYTSTGEIREDWSKNWEQFFDQAEAEGMYVIPTFTGWVNWNNQGFSNWGNNPFRSVYGGPAADPTEIFKRDSPTQLLYLKWFKSVVTRWSSHKNILVWEVITEANLIDGIDEADGVYLCEQLASVAHQADPLHRPVTANLADNADWTELYRSNDIDFISIHPYPGSARLDTTALGEVRYFLAAYHKPVLIGESGLSALDPDNEGKIIGAPNARVGIQHAMWAEAVSGATNGRGLWFEDSFALFYPDLGMAFVQKDTDVEAPAYHFLKGMDMTGFAPMPTQASDKILGAALGNDGSIIGWFRDAGSEPPDWTIQPVISKQTVTLSLPSTATSWKVDFYSAQDGTTLLGSTSLSQQGSSLTVTLPDFKDDIVFKISAQGAVLSSPAPAKNNTDNIAGTWNGTITNTARTFSTPVKLSIQPDCTPGSVCGKFSAPQVSCSGDLYFQAISAQTYVFLEQNTSGSSSCKSGGYEQLQLQADGTLSYMYLTSPVSAASSTGILKNH
jgi:hypothetical protein